MTSEVDICNQALAAIGTRSTIASLTEGSPEAINCSLQYDSTRKKLLRAAHWGFARGFATGSLLKAQAGTPENPTANTTGVWSATYPPPPWLYSYAEPSGCLAVRYVLPQVQNTQPGVPLYSSSLNMPPYALQKPSAWTRSIDTDANGNQVSAILTNESQAIICYTMDIDNIDLWDWESVNAFILALAGNICIALTGDKDLARITIGQANAAILEARVRDGNEDYTVIDVIPDWLRVRGVTGGADFTGQPYIANYGPLFGVL